ncbi:MAG TPA: T9SS type A sorting domain-containing protein [Candidatus Cloacimonadota bacterium]|nr:T9SS type A sorting domain-containing protein [Candidatus Cloacimonadota bacterium]HPT71298.1 T9SS type A sorting domain-containing protein [Candidatus Cloacimonadota bacterium]
MKHSVFLILLFYLCQLYSTTITKSDYGFSAGKTRNFKEGSWNQASTDLTEGTGKVWNFTTPTAGYQNNTYQNCSNVAGFPNANLVQQYSQLLNGYSGTGSMYYQETTDDFLQIGYTGSPNLLWNPSIPTGLPHYLNKTWTSTNTWTYGTYVITGKVIAEGSLTTHWGTHQAVLVRYYYTTTSLSYYCYQWETKEYGIEAYTNTLNGGMLYVLNEAEPNSVPNSDATVTPSPFNVTVYPNPAQRVVNLKLNKTTDEPISLQIYNIRGELVHSENKVQTTQLHWDMKDSNDKIVSAGIYFYRIESDKHIMKGSFVVMK